MTSRQTGHKKPHDRRVLRTMGYVLGMAVACWLVTIWAFGLWVRLGMSEAAATRMPWYGLAVGAALGIGVALAQSLRDLVGAVVGTLVLGGVFWFFGVVLEAILIAFGLPEEIAIWISRIAFALGVMLGAVAVFAVGQDLVKRVWAGRSGLRR
jgi:hypothetical protein